jgi:hypothetical protein
MRINFGNEVTGTPIRDLPVGETFFAQRKSTKEKGLYMKVDGFSGLVKHKYNMNYAVNLASGQLREFERNTIVEKVLTVVDFPKK